MITSDLFQRSDFACTCGCGFDAVDAELLQVLESVWRHFNQRVEITSGCRCPLHNLSVGGSKRSQHLNGKAADIMVAHTPPYVVAHYLESTYPDCYGVGQYHGHTHIDVRTDCARWDST